MRKVWWIVGVCVIASSALVAKVHPKIEEAVKGSFKSVDAIEPECLLLAAKEATQVQQQAKAKVETKLYRYYRLLSHGKVAGYAVLMPRKVRTKKATVLYAFDRNGSLKFSQIMSFGEPPEYIPNDTWMKLFEERDANAKLAMGQDIPTIIGATLSARTITNGARVSREILHLISKETR